MSNQIIKAVMVHARGNIGSSVLDLEDVDINWTAKDATVEFAAERILRDHVDDNLEKVSDRRTVRALNVVCAAYENEGDEEEGKAPTYAIARFESTSVNAHLLPRNGSMQEWFPSMDMYYGECIVLLYDYDGKDPDSSDGPEGFSDLTVVDLARRLSIKLPKSMTKKARTAPAKEQESSKQAADPKKTTDKKDTKTNQEKKKKKKSKAPMKTLLAVLAPVRASGKADLVQLSIKMPAMAGEYVAASAIDDVLFEHTCACNKSEHDAEEILEDVQVTYEASEHSDSIVLGSFTTDGCDDIDEGELDAEDVMEVLGGDNTFMNEHFGEGESEYFGAVVALLKSSRPGQLYEDLTIADFVSRVPALRALEKEPDTSKTSDSSSSSSSSAAQPAEKEASGAPASSVAPKATTSFRVLKKRKADNQSSSAQEPKKFAASSSSSSSSV